MLSRLTDRVSFNETFELPPPNDYILVKCEAENGTSLYTNAHAIIRERANIKKRLKKGAKKYKEKPRPLSVLLLAIDSISKLNLLRTMPNTAKHLQENDWFELEGYNKVCDNPCNCIPLPIYFFFWLPIDF